MSIDINTASILGALVLLMISIIGYFLKAIMAKLSDMEKAKNQTALDIERLKSEVHQVAENGNIRIGKLEERAVRRDTEQADFWRGLPKLIREALTPDFKGINNRLDRLEK